MTDQTPAQELRAAAQHARSGDCWQLDPSLAEPLADWLEREARTHDAGVIAAGQVYADDPAGRDAWIAGQTNREALAVARALLGGDQ